MSLIIPDLVLFFLLKNGYHVEIINVLQNFDRVADLQNMFSFIAAGTVHKNSSTFHSIKCVS